MSTPADSSKTKLQQLVVAGIFLLVAILVIFPMRDYDTFWYLANGRSLFETGQIVDREIFSYTSFGTKFRNIGWLGQYLMYLTFRWGGPDALIGFKVVITLLVSLLLYRTGRILGAPRIWAALLMLFVVYAQLWRFVERTQLFTYLLLALFSYVYHGWRTSKLPEGVIWLVPVIIGGWDLFHGSAYGLLFLGSIVAGESASRIFKTRAELYPGMKPLPPDRFRKLVFSTLLALFLITVNPHGLLHGNLHLIGNVINGKTFASDIGEFLPTTLKGYTPFWILLTAVFATLVLTWKHLPVSSILIAVPFAFLAVRHCRSIEAFGLVTYPILAMGIARGSTFLDRFQPRLHKLLLAVVVMFFATYLLYFKFIKQNYSYTAAESNINDFSFRLGINENYFPVGSSRFVSENIVGGRMFNSDRYGGYLAYFLSAKHPIFHYNHPSIFKNIYGYLHNPAERLKFGITYAIVARDDEVQMYKREGFVPVYWEPTAMVLLKPSLENRALIQRYAIRHFRPLLDATQLRTIAADPKLLPRLMVEISDYLAFRKDERIKTLFVELLKRSDSPFTGEQKKALLERVRRYNGNAIAAP